MYVYLTNIFQPKRSAKQIRGHHSGKQKQEKPNLAKPEISTHPPSPAREGLIISSLGLEHFDYILKAQLSIFQNKKNYAPKWKVLSCETF